MSAPIPKPSTAPSAGLAALRPLVVVPMFDDFGVPADRFRTLGDPPSAREHDRHFLVSVPAPDAARFAAEILQLGERETGPDGVLAVFCAGPRADGELARLRNALWPAWHVTALYRAEKHEIVRVTLAGAQPIRSGCAVGGTLVVARRRAAVMAPDVTSSKFDANAAGWNGNPGKPGYRHFRWMRRFVGTLADASRARRILDFGCGAGWVGIEAALAARAAGGTPFLAAFDPSPAMIEIATANAKASAIERFEGRVGFGESPPFPAAGEEPFDLVISSGVISFAPDTERWLDGLVGTLAPQATLVIGDIHRDSRGMQKRRAERPLLPVREMNATTRAPVRAALEARGLVHETGCGYQLSDPMPQLLHLDATKLGGLLEGFLVKRNERASRRELAGGPSDQDRFDSWVTRFTRRG